MGFAHRFGRFEADLLQIERDLLGVFLIHLAAPGLNKIRPSALARNLRQL